MIAAVGSPYISGSTITPSDVTILNPATRGIYVGTTGNLSVILANDTVATVFNNVAAGFVLPLRATKVKATGTTASNLVALY